jgi:hypothetical protein
MDRQRRLERIATYWSQAKDPERWLLLRRAIEGDPSVPSLEEIHLAAFLAEAAQGTVDGAPGPIGQG